MRLHFSKKNNPMDSNHSAQDVTRCDLCETPVPPMHCDICHINICKACVVDHLSDESTDHKVVSFKKRGSTVNYPKCQEHSQKICEVYCRHCNVPICASCVSSGDHDQHEKVDILKIVINRKKIIEKDLRELKESIYARYEEAASEIPTQKDDLRSHSKKLTTALDKQREALYAEIDTIIQEIKSEIDDMDAHHIAAIAEQEDAINHTIKEITQAILDLQNLLDSEDVCRVFKYTSRNEEFRSLPAQFKVTLPDFIPKQIDREQMYQQIGSLSNLPITCPDRRLIDETAEGRSSPKQNPDAIISPPVRTFIDNPCILADIKTKYEKLCSVSCPSDSELWTCGYNDNIMTLYNLQGKVLKSVRTKSGNEPCDIALIQSEGLVYTDAYARSINLVGDTQIQTMIAPWRWVFKGWRPRGVCSTSSGDLLVIMDSDDGTQSKLVRYSGSSEKESFQWDDQDMPLYSPGNIKYLTENRNFDICVADYHAEAVVVVSAAGKLRFRYPGGSPRGISTDSQANILIANFHGHRINIIDQDGHFLRYIDICGLLYPHGLCVDSSDNLFVVEYRTGKVKKIQYYK